MKPARIDSNVMAMVAPVPVDDGADAALDAAAQAWQALHGHGQRLRGTSLRDLFANNAGRFGELSFELEDLTVDFSKEKIDADALRALLHLAQERQVCQQRDAMFAGEPVNNTQERAALHVAARDPKGHYAGMSPAQVEQSLGSFLGFAEGVREGTIRAADGGRFSAVIALGVGGSDLGPAMVTSALSSYAGELEVGYVSNVDDAELAATIGRLDAARTLVVVQSKSFTTQETMTNAAAVRDWLAAAVGAGNVYRHMVAVSANVAAALEFGIAADRVFGFWDCIGGRYSVWTSIGLPVALSIGARRFREFLAGARSMDLHFLGAPPASNIPLLMGLIGVWRRNIMGASSVAVVPYNARLRRLPAYLQQLMMESNGKSVTRDGLPVEHATCPVVWGEVGTDAQHSFFQLLHQGSDIIPTDFIAAISREGGARDSSNKLLANFVAQSQALAFGRTAGEVRARLQRQGVPEASITRLLPHLVCAGGRSSTSILFATLSPYTLGRLLALYEHKTFVEAALWGINAFDQWGVELGKELSAAVLPLLEDGGAQRLDGVDMDESTKGLLKRIHSGRSAAQ